MTTLPVFDRSGSEVGSYDIDPAELAPKINKQLLHDVVVMYQANRRQGSAHTRSRSDVSGSTRKLYRQKGTGNARAGSRRSNIRRGGGHTFAKRHRDFSYRLPRKAVRAATRMAIASKILDEQMVVIDELSFGEPRTSEMALIIKSLGLNRATVLVAVAGHDVNIYKSVRNLPLADVYPVCDLNALAVLTPDKMLVTRAALDAIRSGSSGEQSASASAESASADSDMPAGDQ